MEFYRESHRELFARAGIDANRVERGEARDNTGARDSDMYEYQVYFTRYVVEEGFGGKNTYPITKLYRVEDGLYPVADDLPLAEMAKIRRRIEDRLRKGTDAEILRLARSLGVETAP